ncbi:MAG: acyl-CoA dehydrogenase family protein [Bacteroidetes bacterium]|nr:acyl-CoA dehydrogenase family protein [Bacteroidota bacterium]
MLSGGEFLIKNQEALKTFIPENFDEEQKMIADMCRDFIENEIDPKLDQIDKLEDGLMQSLLKEAGNLGLLGTGLPEEYGGFGKDEITFMLQTEVLGTGHSFAVAFAAHTGIGTLPIYYYGTEEQKNKYLPKLASGEWLGAYCLTEPGSGSDARAAKTQAVLSEDGNHYILNGQKMWITNAGFADVFTVFAQIDSDKFTAFIVERGYEGVSFGNEEHKMGIKGSSTRQVFFNDVKVPKENLLGEIGKGHYIAFNILNIGRLKLAAATLGGAKKAAAHSLKYANERHQFKQPISGFGAIQHKLAEQLIKTYALETTLFRTTALVEEQKQKLMKEGKTSAEAILAAAEEYSIECAILKVFGSEALDYVVDEGVQILGGYGFSEEFPLARAYRDSRINRIFEGTNEINRLLSVDMVVRKALKGQLDLLGPAMAVQNELMGIPDFGDSDDSFLAAEKKAIENMRKSILMVAGAAFQQLGLKMKTEQEVIMRIADMAIDMYVAESLVLRIERLHAEHDLKTDALQVYVAKTFIFDAMERIHTNGKNAINAFAEGDVLRMMTMGLKRFSKYEAFNTIKARRNIAATLIADNSLKYFFG